MSRVKSSTGFTWISRVAAAAAVGVLAFVVAVFVPTDIERTGVSGNDRRRRARRNQPG